MNNLSLNLLAVSELVSKSFPIIRIVIMVLIVVMSIALTVIVLIQPSNSEGMGALSGQSSDTFYSKNKGRSIEGILKRLTIILAISIAVLSVIFFITLSIYAAGA